MRTASTYADLPHQPDYIIEQTLLSDFARIVPLGNSRRAMAQAAGQSGNGTQGVASHRCSAESLGHPRRDIHCEARTMYRDRDPMMYRASPEAEPANAPRRSQCFIWATGRSALVPYSPSGKCELRRRIAVTDSGFAICRLSAFTSILRQANRKRQGRSNLLPWNAAGGACRDATH